MPTFNDVLDKSLRRITAPTSEPITVKEAKAHCSIPESVVEFDPQFREWIQAAREQVESDSERCLMLQTWELAFDQLMTIRGHRSSCATWNGLAIELRRVPVISVDSFVYQHPLNGETPMTEGVDYLFNPAAEPGLITPPPAKPYWPYMQPQLRGVVITFTAGYPNPSSVPGLAKQAMRMLIAHWWRNREAAAERPSKDHDRAYSSLINALSWRA